MLPGRLLLLRNPQARRAVPEAVLLTAAALLRDPAWRIEVRSTGAPGEATALAAEAAADAVDAVVAVGGDGTVHEVVNGLAGTDTALGVVPAGTANVWATEAGVPRDAAAAIAFLAGARTARVDVGRVAFDSGGSRRFLLMCSAGLDAEVVRRVGQGGRGKRLLGPVWYGAVGAMHGARDAPARAHIEVDGARFERDVLLAVAGNTRLYGGVVRLTAAARADDGLLDLCAFSGSSLFDRAQLAARALRGGLERRTGDGVTYARGAEIRIEAERPLAVQADGEYVGETPLTIRVEPRALSVLIAPDPSPLLSGETG